MAFSMAALRRGAFYSYHDIGRPAPPALKFLPDGEAAVARLYLNVECAAVRPDGLEVGAAAIPRDSIAGGSELIGNILLGGAAPVHIAGGMRIESRRGRRHEITVTVQGEGRRCTRIGT